LPNKLLMLPYIFYFAIRVFLWRPVFIHCHLFHNIIFIL
jgi:hypothetical protein